MLRLAPLTKRKEPWSRVLKLQYLRKTRRLSGHRDPPGRLYRRMLYPRIHEEAPAGTIWSHRGARLKVLPSLRLASRWRGRSHRRRRSRRESLARAGFPFSNLDRCWTTTRWLPPFVHSRRLLAIKRTCWFFLALYPLIIARLVSKYVLAYQAWAWKFRSVQPKFTNVYEATEEC